MSVIVSRRKLLAGAVITALLAAGCGAGATPTPTGPLAFHMQITPSHVSAAIAVDQGFFTRVKPSYTLVGYAESSQLFHAGTDPIGNETPWEAAVYQDQGKDIRYFSTAEASNALQGIIIRTEDAAKYKSLSDLKGQKVGRSVMVFRSSVADYMAKTRGMSKNDPRRGQLERTLD